MKYKLLSVNKFCTNVNIGDYIQALASSQFYDKIDGFIERDELKQYNGEECKVIMNGWYMGKPENFPPSDKVVPLFVALHINSSIADKMLTPESISYLKEHAPIGCRDTYTRDLLLSKGVDAYFSGCMTLTLGNTYKTEEKDGMVYFVDPYFITKWNFLTTLCRFFYLLFHFIPIYKIAKKYPEKKILPRKLMILTGFYKEYSKYFHPKLLTNATYICQQSEEYKEKFRSDEELLKEAKRLINNYSRADLVVTSRIHCALPCLGLDTPVIYTDHSHKLISGCRLGGLKELFNVITWKDGKLHPNFEWKGSLSESSQMPQNKADWKELATNLSKKCEEFINSTINY